MPIQLVCPLCGDELKCEKAHEGPYDVPPEIVKCAPTKGGLHVVVRDNHQKGVPGVKVYSDGSGKGNGDSTDDLGFAYFEQLPAKDYPTRIVLDESAKDVREGYYTETRVSVSAEVKAGQITMVEFALIKYATMLVILSAFTGELLTWDNDAYWRVRAILADVETIPLLGPELAAIVRGGSEVSATTLSRTYSAHSLFVPWMVWMLLISSFGLIVRDVRRGKAGGS